MTKETWTNNQNLLYAAREKVLARGNESPSHRLFQFRLNPSDPTFPLSYRRLDKATLNELARELELV
jgi:hypothetical protein